MMLYIDFETRSRCDLQREGLYRYAKHPSTDVLCVAYAIDDGPVQSVRQPNLACPWEIIFYLREGCPIMAHNAAFERLLWAHVLGPKYGWPVPKLEQFRCSGVLSRARGGPSKLEKAALFHEFNVQKDMEGHRLMLKMCKPKADGTWHESPQDLARLVEYCKRDVEVERLIVKHLLPMKDEEWAQYHLSERINDRGVAVDLELASAAVECAAFEKEEAAAMIQDLTDGAVTAPTEVVRILAWLRDRGIDMPDLAKGTIEEYLPDIDNPVARQVLELRLDQGKAAVSKFQAMLDRQQDGKLCGLYVYHGAGQTGRWASHGVQVHNLVRDTDLKAVKILLNRGSRGLRLLGPAPAMLAKMVRPALVPEPGSKFIIGDYNAIEARVTAWLAGENRLLSAFAEGRDVYCEFASLAFGWPITKADTKERFVGKGCILGLGFGGGPNALARTLKLGKIALPADKLEYLVNLYRQTYPAIRRYWYALQDAVLNAIYSPNTIVTTGRVSWLYDGRDLWCRLPSGRFMCYPYATVIQDGPNDAVVYRRGNRSPKQGEKEWPTVNLWYGMIMENLAQGVARDLLAAALQRIDGHDGMLVRLHTHDEIVVSSETPEQHLPVFIKLMEELPDWADGLPVAVEASIAERYE